MRGRTRQVGPRSWQPGPLGLLVLVLVGSCVEAPRASAPEPRPPRDAPSPRPGVPFDVGAVVRRVASSFRQEGEAFAAAGTTWAAVVDAKGLSLTPAHHPEKGEVVRGGAVRLGPAVLSRGSRLLSTGTGRPRVDSRDGHLVLPQPEVEEHLQPRAEGLEQSWTFARAPEGEGDVVVRLPLASGRYVDDTSSGLHLRAGEGPGVRYGHGVWVDAAGGRTPVPARFEEGAVVLRVPEALLTATRWPAVLDPLLSPELGVDAPVRGPAQGVQASPAVAYGGGVFLVVWEDGRLDAQGHLYGARVAADGQLLDVAGLRLAGGFTRPVRPRLASDGTDFLVVWQDGRPQRGQEVWGVRLSREGVLRDAQPLLLASGEGDDVHPDVVWAGAHYLVGWVSDPPGAGSQVVGLRLSREGLVLDAAPLTLVAGTQLKDWPALAWDGTRLLVSWQQWDSASSWDVYAARLTPAGLPLPPGPFALTQGALAQLEPTVVALEDGFLVAWTDLGGGTGTTVRATRVEGSGRVVDTGGQRLSSGSASALWPTGTATPEGPLLVWAEIAAGGRSLQRLQLSREGLPVEASRQTLPVAPAQRPALAQGPRGALLAWTDGATSSEGSDIFGLLLAGGGPPPGTPTLLSASAAREAEARVAWNGRQYLAAWRDFREDALGDIHAARLGADGSRLQEASLPLATAAGAELQPAVASDGRGFLVVWTHAVAGGARVEAALLGEEGSPPLALVLTETALGAQAPTVASDGEGYLVAWQERLADGGSVLALTRVGADGTVRDVPALRLPVEANARAPALAFLGRDALLLWSGSAPGAPSRLQARWLREAQEALVPEAPFEVASGAGALLDAAVASDGVHLLVAWREEGTQALRATRLTAQGPALDVPALLLAEGPRALGTAALAWTGAHFLAVWADGSLPEGPTVFGRRVLPDGTFWDLGPVALGTAGKLRGNPALASGSASSLLVHTGFDAAPDAQGWRVLARVVRDGTRPRATSLALTTAEDTPLPLPLSVEDDDCSGFRFQLTQPPARGSLQGSWPQLTYVPAENVNGLDAFRYRVEDCTGEPSEEATVSLTLTPVNDAPRASSQTLRLSGPSALLPLEASDVEGDALTYVVTQPPQTGSLSSVPGGLAYVPPEDFRGKATFRYRVSDGELSSEEATVTLVVRNTPPTLRWLGPEGVLQEGTAYPFGVVAEDAEGDGVQLRWDFGDGTTAREASPRHAFPNEGLYRVQLVAFDGYEEVSQAVVLQVDNVAPVIQSLEASVGAVEGTALTLRVRASDPGVQDVLAYVWDFGDGRSALGGPEVAHVFPDSGRYQVRALVSDDAGAGTEQSLEVEVANLPPVVEHLQPQRVLAGETLSLKLHASDPGGAADPLLFVHRGGPGKLSESGEWTWTPARNVVGHHVVRVTVLDDERAETDLAFIVTVEPAVALADLSCHCQQAGSASLLPLALVLLLFVSRRRRCTR